MGIQAEDADDLCQQAFVVAMGSGKVFPFSHRRQRRWLSQISWRIGMNFLRLRRHAYEEVRGELFEAPDVDRDELLSRVHARAVLRVALGAMTPEERALLFEHYVEEATLEEIGARLGLTRSAVWSRLKRLLREAAERARELTDQCDPMA